MKSWIKKGLNQLLSPLGLEVHRKQEPPKDPYRKELYERLYSPQHLAQKPFINIGAGGFSHPYWTNLDFVSEWYAPMQKEGLVQYDMMALKPLPFDDASIEAAYTSHAIEHVTEEAVKNVFKEVYRVLKPGAYFRVTTGPDSATDYAAMMREDEDWFYWDEWYTEEGSFEHLYKQSATSVPVQERWLHHVASSLAPNSIDEKDKKVTADEIKKLAAEMTREELLDHLTKQCEFRPQKPGNHISWWDGEKIIAFLKEAGFGEVYLSGFKQSRSPLMRRSTLFDHTHPQISVYVEARK